MATMWTEDEPLAPPKPLDLPRLIRGNLVTCAGRLASMPRPAFQELIESYGGTLTHRVGSAVVLVVIGQHDWPLTRNGTLPEVLRKLRVLRRNEGYAPRVVSEEQFLDVLGLRDHLQSVHRHFTAATLGELLGVTQARIRAWISAGLIKPAYSQHGVSYFDFAQASAAKTLCELARSGITIGRLRKSLEQLRAWLPDAENPLEQLATLEGPARMLIRLNDGELAGFDGQFHFDFDRSPGEPQADAPLLRIAPSTTSASEWRARGSEQLELGYHADAVESFRQALLAGGPNAETCYDLAHALMHLGRHREAAERFRQAVEIQPRYADAWNNLGAALCEIGERDQACEAFRKALAINPNDSRVHYNLADTLDELGQWSRAAVHWRVYLLSDNISDRSAYVRDRLAGANSAESTYV